MPLRPRALATAQLLRVRAIGVPLGSISPETTPRSRLTNIGDGSRAHLLAERNFSLPAKPPPAGAGEITPSTLAAFTPATKNRSETAIVGLTTASTPEVGAV